MLWYNFSNWLFVPFIKTFSLSPTMIVEKQKFKNYEGKNTDSLYIKLSTDLWSTSGVIGFGWIAYSDQSLDEEKKNRHFFSA
jgi:hypothetical protein